MKRTSNDRVDLNDIEPEIIPIKQEIDLNHELHHRKHAEDRSESVPNINYE